VQKTVNVFTVAALIGFFAVGAADLGAQASPAEGWAAGTLVVVSGEADEALLIDPSSQRVLGRFQTGPDPREVAMSPDGRFAYVTSYGWVPGLDDATASVAGEATLSSPDGRGVTVLDLAQRRVHATFQPRDYLNLEAIRVADDGRRLWMTSREGGVVELDAHTGEVKMLWKTESTDPGTLTVTRDSRRVYVANTDSDQVTMIDRVTVVPEQVRTGSRPRGLALSNDQRELWVANSGDHTISVINTRRLEEEARFSSGGVGPTRLRFSPSGSEVWVSHRGTQDVVVLDVASAAVLARIPIDGEPRSLTFSDDGTQVFVSVPSRHRVDVLDVSEREVIGSLDAGRGPAGVAWSDHGPGMRGSR
jgi:YVTN family beta-propeller protein